MKKSTVLLALMLVAAAFCTAAAQTLPTSQPNYLQIYREMVKVGHAAEHAKVEAGWPMAFERAKDPYVYISLVSMTGQGEAWFVVPFDSHQAMADSQKRETDPMLQPTLDRLSVSDAEHLSGTQSIIAMARKDLSCGGFPPTASQRFFDVTIFRVRPGHTSGFVAAAKAYAAATGRAAPNSGYRVYQVIAGMPNPTFLVFSSVTSYGAFDKSMADGEATMKAATEEEMNALEKFSSDGLINSETIRFRLDPMMSYVPKEVRAEDPEFWMPKPAPKPVATPKPTPAPGRKVPNSDPKR